MGATTTPTGSPLRQRMIEDMHMRRLAQQTQEAYIRAVVKLAAFLKRSPDTATIEDLRHFQLHGRHRHLARHAERHDHGAEVLLRSHA